MKKKSIGTFGIVCLFMFSLYASIWSMAAGDDRQLCRIHGYTNSYTSLSLEGFCEKEVAPNVTESIRVEDLILFKTKHERTSHAAMCIRNRNSSKAC